MTSFCEAIRKQAKIERAIVDALNGIDVEQNEQKIKELDEGGYLTYITRKKSRDIVEQMVRLIIDVQPMTGPSSQNFTLRTRYAEAENDVSRVPESPNNTS